MEWALNHHPFDTLTIVDSDQLALRPGYSGLLEAHLKGRATIGVLGNSAAVQKAGTRIGPAEIALREIELWRPLLREFQEGEEKFVHWCFWPSTVFTADAARDLTGLFTTNSRLQEIMRQTRIWASEELILPTLVALLGYEVGTSPCSYDYVQYRVLFSLPHLEAALSRDNVFWMHPVPRRYDDPLRKRIRERWGHYEPTQPKAETLRPPASNSKAGSHGLMLTLPIIERMRAIEGWLDDTEADLLIAAVRRAVAVAPQPAAVVEIGSYCGKSTVVIGSALKAFDDAQGVKLYAIDPHDGIVGALDQGITQAPPTLDKFRQNIANAGLGAIVESVKRRSFEVQWSQPISLLFIDGLHDYANVARDFYHFEASVLPGGLVGFHDYADYYPGVKAFVDELLAHRRYEKVHLALSLMLVRKRTAADVAEDELERASVAAAAETPGAPAIISREPMVSCIMPTANRRVFVPQAIRYFLQQNYARRELIILDDGTEELADVIPDDSRIRYQRMVRRYTMGAKLNMACELAHGEIVVHWDDDDWMAEWRIAYQVESLLTHPTDTLCGLSRILFYEPRAERAWEYVYPMVERPWVSGATFCYRREFWETHRHPDMNEGADTVFAWGLRDAHVLALEKNEFYVAIVHPNNSSPKRTNDPAWHSIPSEKIYRLLEENSSFYQQLGQMAVQ